MKRRKNAPDFILLATTLLLVGIGLPMVYSASEYVSRHAHSYDYFFIRRQIAWVCLGALAMFVASKFNYWNWSRLATPMLLVSLVLLVLVLIPGIGIERNFSRRWLGFGPFVFQPSEVAKMSLAIFMAKMLSTKGKKMEKFGSGLLPPLLLTGLVFGLVAIEDLGTAIAIGAIAAVLIFVAGAKMQHLMVMGTLAVGAVGVLIATAGYRINRLRFWDPWSDPANTGYQMIQSMFALGPGGLFGRGLGLSMQKRFYLPEPHTDFILSIIGEELGFLGTGTIIALFALFTWRGFRIAISAPDDMATLLAVALTTMIGLQAIINIAVITGSIPTTGIPLPLISAGGSSLIFTMGSIGILLNISKYVKG